MTRLYEKVGSPGSNGRRTTVRWIAGLALASVLLGGSIAGATQPASAANYPTFEDLQNARSSESAKQAEIAVVTQLLSGLADQVRTTQAASAAAGTAAQVAQTKLDTQSQNADIAAAAAATANEQARKSRVQAGLIAAKLAQTGGGSDLSATLFFNSGSASNLLSKLGLAGEVKDQSAGIYAIALNNEKTAASVTAQAVVAKNALKALSDQATKAATEFASAAGAATSALDDQQSHDSDLKAQLAVLSSATAITEAGYNAGIAAAAAAKAAAAAAAAAAQAAAAQAANSAPSGTSVNLGQVTAGGWTRPSAGHLSSPYGERLDPYTKVYQLHAGTDLAPGCGSPIYAAHSGTVVLAGIYGGYGNYIRITDSGDSSYQTAYGHIVNGGILVHLGQQVTVGQQIGLVGSTGWATGCNLHFEIHHNGRTQDPVPFMRSVGVSLTN